MKTAADNKVEVIDSVNTFYNLANGTKRKHVVELVKLSTFFPYLQMTLTFPVY